MGKHKLFNALGVICNGHCLQWRRWLLFSSAVVWIALLLLAGVIVVRTAVAFHQYPEPQAILILDGNNQRVRQGATFAAQYPDLPVWISGYCSQRSKVQDVFADAHVSARVHYDLRATDTVTHFTTLVDDFVEQGIRHVYVVTSDFHMARARAIATIILGSHGVVWTPNALPSNYRDESWLKVIRDGGRSLVWLATGHSGSRFNGRNPERCL